MLEQTQQDSAATIAELERRITKLEEDIRAADARFKIFFQATPLGLFESTEEGFCTYISPEWAELTGRPPSELLGFGWHNTLHPEEVEKAREVWHNAHVTGGPY